jgi:hypothetical protein
MSKGLRRKTTATAKRSLATDHNVFLRGTTMVRGALPRFQGSRPANFEPGKAEPHVSGQANEVLGDANDAVAL